MSPIALAFPAISAEFGVEEHRASLRMLEALGGVGAPLELNSQHWPGFELTAIPALDSTTIQRTTEQLRESLRAGGFLEEIDGLRRRLIEDSQLQRTTTIEVAGLSAGFSIAYLLWLIRGGVLLSSYFGAMPAWQLLDPLPVLARAGQVEEQEDDDLLAQERMSRIDPFKDW